MNKKEERNLHKDMLSRSPNFESLDSSISIPSYIFRDRTLKPLEAISEFLKEHKGLTIHQIAKLLNRDDRTIWTVYQRAKQKRK